MDFEALCWEGWGGEEGGGVMMFWVEWMLLLISLHLEGSDSSMDGVKDGLVDCSLFFYSKLAVQCIKKIR